MYKLETKQMPFAELLDYERNLREKGFSKLENILSEKELQPNQFFVRIATVNPNSFDGEKIATVTIRIS